MGDPAEKEKGLSFEEYVALEKARGIRFEYLHGQVFAMAGGTDLHNEITGNIREAIKRGTRGKNCKVYAENVKLELLADHFYVYPDVMLTCDEKDHEDRFIKRSPALLVEVLSSSTAAEDRFGKKFQAYLKIPSLQYYLLVSQQRVRVEVYSRETHRKGWHYETYEALDELIAFPALGLQLLVSDIYDEVLG